MDDIFIILKENYMEIFEDYDESKDVNIDEDSPSNINNNDNNDDKWTNLDLTPNYHSKLHDEECLYETIWSILKIS